MDVANRSPPLSHEGWSLPWPKRLAGSLSGGIAWRLLASVLLVSGTVTLALTAFQLYLDYRREIGSIETRLDEIGRSSLGSLSEGLWNLDRNQVQAHLNGFMRLPDIRAAEVREAGDRANLMIVTAGERATRSKIGREFPLVYALAGKEQPLGTFYVEATLTQVYRELIERALIILLSQGAKTFIVSLFILYIFHWLVTRHLRTIADFAGQYDVGRPPAPLALQRQPPPEADELDRVVAAINGFSASLQCAYDSLRAAKERLEEDVRAREQVEERLRASEQRFRDYAETASDWLWESGPDHSFVYLSDQARDFGIEGTLLTGTRREDTALDLASEPEKWRAHLDKLERHAPFRHFEYKRLDADGRLRHVSVSGRPIFDSSGQFTGYRGTATDLTVQHEAEERLHQLQKMDSIGQLTGGIAHDFNNILTVITGTIEVLAEGVADRPQLATIASMIDQAAMRGAALTQQLLAFARRQPLQPRRTDVNKLLRDTERLLRSTLGEHIEIDAMLAPDAWPALVDSSQLATALLNLAVNARDAMPQGGGLTLETGNVILEQPYADANPGVVPGEYVMLAISDSGVGIPAQLIDKVFEPFFTTKEVGKGTGLGLSMVYGFVKQSGGHIKVYSEEGQGTTIKLYLPRGTGEAETEAPPPEVAEGGDETVLVVEDDEQVRTFAITQLTSLGYTTLAAANAREALAILDSDAQIDLLFTDVIMPGGMNGRQLAEEATRRNPSLAVLYTSGYTENAVVHHGRLDPGVTLLNKPYRRLDLARKVREALAARWGGAGLS
jgi:PAS domain S-box-containing protein